MIDVIHTAYALPENIGCAQAWAAAYGGGATRGEALRAHGCDAYRYLAGEDVVGLGVRAIDQLIAESGLERTAVDALIVFQTSPCNALPMPFTLAGALREGAQLSRSWALSIGQQHCVSPVHALRVLVALFARHPDWRHAILVGVDTILREELRAIGIAGLHSDAASAMLIGRPGSGARLCAVETYNDPQALAGIDDAGQYRESPNYLWALISVIRRILRSSGTPVDALASILPHNVNRPAWHQALAAIRLPSERLYDANFGRIGHAFGSDAAINLADSGALRRAGRHLVFASGIGGCFGGFLLETGALR